MVIWITGISGSGKTSLCKALLWKLKPRLPQLVLIDGDEVRAMFGGDLGFTESDRKVQIGRIQRLAKILSDQGLVVLIAALYCHPELLGWNRRNLTKYFEIYLNAPLDLVESRDSKGLYTGAKEGRIPNVVGVDIPWHPPQSPDLVLDATKFKNPDEMAIIVVQAIAELNLDDATLKT